MEQSKLPKKSNYVSSQTSGGIGNPGLSTSGGGFNNSSVSGINTIIKNLKNISIKKFSNKGKEKTAVKLKGSEVYMNLFSNYTRNDKNDTRNTTSGNIKKVSESYNQTSRIDIIKDAKDSNLKEKEKDSNELKEKIVKSDSPKLKMKFPLTTSSFRVSVNEKKPTTMNSKIVNLTYEENFSESKETKTFNQHKEERCFSPGLVVNNNEFYQEKKIQPVQGVQKKSDISNSYLKMSKQLKTNKDNVVIDNQLLVSNNNLMHSSFCKSQGNLLSNKITAKNSINADKQNIEDDKKRISKLLNNNFSNPNFKKQDQKLSSNEKTVKVIDIYNMHNNLNVLNQSPIVNFVERKEEFNDLNENVILETFNTKNSDNNLKYNITEDIKHKRISSHINLQEITNPEEIHFIYVTLNQHNKKMMEKAEIN